ncbi:aspartate-semialdehyde dehydrogenase [Pseudomonas indica]|uniref:aspartate-semialdehyde dehydrogenase n=1 Tax=Pseudomonas indica TaxID=137658 RepID=UPI0023F86287|nr:aspartate-semialdehyde dehydrogenase [Pseudomonas indica]MBU3057345.1 aspartate-semialdehyde dehydrogenase [Pseudomonas indica]
MSQSFDIAVIGATGTVGEALVQLLEERDFPVSTLHLLASGDSAGQSVPFRGKNLRVRALDGFDFSQVRLAFFAGSPAVTREYASHASEAGCSFIDLSGALSLDDAIRVVPEVNADVLAGLKAPYRLTSPCAPVVALATALAPLHPLLDLRQVCVMACLSVSTLGREGVNELARQTAELLNARPLEPRFFDRQAAFNLLAQVGEVDSEGHALLEKRMVSELKQMFRISALDVSATCVQAPVFFGDSLSVMLRSEKVIDLQAICAALDDAQGIERVESPNYPTVVGDAVGQDVVYVGRLRCGLGNPHELNLWIASDNVRKGAALNAVQLGELLIKDYLSKILT